ncbi:MAG: 30S ribosomal protein S16, partial [Bacteroidetes bacterium]|nr:30S ribosomal protein S16 [Bacteroidota bacterium]
MPTKIRLQRRGKKARPFYHIVIADGRAPRDGKFIEKIGTYNPITNPADIQLNFDRALYWLQTGAQPTDTVRDILSYKGVIYKNHLLTGVKKGALTEEQAEAKFQAWLSEKEAKIENAKKDAELSLKDTRKKALEVEKLVKENRSKEIAAKRAAAVEAEVEAVKEEAKAEEDQKSEEVKAEEPKEETKEEVKAEEPKEEAKEEVKAEEPKEEAKEEVKAEEPKEEAKEEVKAE